MGVQSKAITGVLNGKVMLLLVRAVELVVIAQNNPVRKLSAKVCERELNH